MARWAYILTTFFTLAAWAGAQGPVPASTLTPADQLRLLKANGTLIDNLVDHGVKLSNANDPVARVEHCRSAAKALANAAHDAAGKQDAERVAELTGLFRQVVQDALLPTLDDAKRIVPPQSPGAERIKQIRRDATNDVIDLKTAIPATGTMAENARVKAELKELDALLAKDLK